MDQAETNDDWLQKNQRLFPAATTSTTFNGCTLICDFSDISEYHMNVKGTKRCFLS